MMVKLAVKQPLIVNRSSPLLLHENARPQTAREIVVTLQELQFETIRHPPYSPVLATTDYHENIFLVLKYGIPHLRTNTIRYNYI